jgi:hypothetical protein
MPSGVQPRRLATRLATYTYIYWVTSTSIGAELTHTGYVRDREWKFAAPYMPRAELLAGIAATQQELACLTDTHLATRYPLLVWEAPASG